MAREQMHSQFLDTPRSLTCCAFKISNMQCFIFSVLLLLIQATAYETDADAAATPIGYLLKYSSSSTACPSTLSKTYKVVGKQMGVCTPVVPVAPDYAQSTLLSGCTASNPEYGGSYKQTLYYSTNCDPSTVIR